MTDLAFIFTILSLLSALTVLALPRRFAGAVVIASGAGALAIYAPASLLWLAMLILLVRGAALWGDRQGRRDLPTALVTIVAVAALLILREAPGIVWIGGAYFTLRNLHLLFDWWQGRYPMPGLPALLRYNFFLPVLIAGPIHRFPNFQREWDRRRTSAQDIACGAERVLLGFAACVILGGWMLGEAMAPLQENPSPGFWQQWAISALEWVYLYFVFAGLSAIAIGIAQMMGLRIEENFNRPWQARNLVEFWSRWHMTLSGWCRDYIYKPAAAASRSPVLGVLAAMLALGIWHESSLYYVMWAMWQTAGIVGSHLLARRMPPLPAMLGWLIGPLLVLGWLSLASPVLSMISPPRMP